MNGILNVLKPSGITSSDIVVRIRGVIRTKLGYREKVGHFGTLDPNATGVLAVALGNCNKLFNYQLNKNKLYRAGFCFTANTDTLDSYGCILEKASTVPPTLEQFTSAILSLQGKRPQMPPNFSAKKQDGEAVYIKARKGQEIVLTPQVIEVFSIDNIKQVSDTTFMADIRCSSGTYIRSFAKELSDLLGVCCYMDRLVRMECCGLDIRNAITFDRLEEDICKYVIPCNQFLSEYPKINLNQDVLFKLINGQSIHLKGISNARYLVSVNGDLFGLGEVTDQELKIIVRLYENA